MDVALEVTQRSAVPYAGIPVWVTLPAGRFAVLTHTGAPKP